MSWVQAGGFQLMPANANAVGSSPELVGDVEECGGDVDFVWGWVLTKFVYVTRRIFLLYPTRALPPSVISLPPSPPSLPPSLLEWDGRMDGSWQNVWKLTEGVWGSAERASAGRVP